MPEAAYTAQSPVYPAYINMQIVEALGIGWAVKITVRGSKLNAPDGSEVREGETAQIVLPLDDWDQFVAQAQQVRVSAGNSAGSTDDLEG